MNSILIKDYMDYNPLVIPASYTVKEVVISLLKAGVSGAPVVDQNNSVVGFISEQDCIKELLNSSYYGDGGTKVVKLMRRDVLAVSPESSILEIAELMEGNKPKNFPVVDDGKIIGIIRRSGVLKALSVSPGSFVG